MAQRVTILPIKSLEDAWRALDELAQAINDLQGGQGVDSTVAAATTSSQGVVKVDDNSAGDPIALTFAGHGSEPSPHSGHATLENGLVPAIELGVGTADATTFLRGDQTYAVPSGGAPGPPGAAGRAGVSIPGRDGARGPWGVQGPPGPQGSPGAAGVAGPGGPQGPAGPYIPGRDGAPGRDGMPVPGPAGPQGPAGGAGPAGPQGIVGPGHVVIDGKPGPMGFPLPGPQGIQGPQGVQGLPGVLGLDGKPGPMGLVIPGPQGLAGAAGGVGATGPQGPMGAVMLAKDGQRGRDAIPLAPFPMGPQFFAKRLGANYTNNAVALTAVAGLTMPLSVGSWLFEYYLCYQSAALTTGIALSVNFTGTVTTFLWDEFWGAIVAADATAGADQDQILVTAAPVRVFSNRAKFTTLRGVTISVDTINADMLMRIAGIAEVTVAGNIELWAASEVAASQITVKAGSLLCLTQAL